MNSPTDSPDLPGAPRARRVAIVGVGPRGLSVFERIIANAEAASGADICVELFEPHEFGSGAVWRTGQPRELIMNIYASQITVFTDDTVDMAGPVCKGPRLYEWARMVAHGVIGGYSDEVVEEAAGIAEHSYCRRYFYGHYLEWVYAELKRGRPPGVGVREHRSKVVSVADTPHGTQLLTTEDGESVEVDEVVLALGHGEVRPSAEEQSLTAFANAASARYWPPSDPSRPDLSAVAAGETVLIRGLGLSFFDYVARLTTGRGGRFLRVDGELRYLRSGAEPHVVAGSRRGIPLQGRADNEKGDRRYEPVFLTEEVVARLRGTAGRDGAAALDFRCDCWPLIAKEVETVYYRTLVAERESTSAAQRFLAEYRDAPWGSSSEEEVLRAFRVTEDERWDWNRIARPWASQDADSVGSWQRFIRRYLLSDVAESRRGNVTSHVKAAVDVLRDIRNEIRGLINDGGIEGGSHRRDVADEFNSLHAFLSLGPPWTRIEELVALMDAGVVRLAGPQFRVQHSTRDGHFVGTSAVPGDVVTAGSLIDARLPRPDLARTTNPVLVDLRRRRQVTPFGLRGGAGELYLTGGVAVTSRPFRVIGEDGAVSRRRYAFGVPTEGANWATETGIRPFVSSMTAADSDAIARSVLGIVSEGEEE